MLASLARNEDEVGDVVHICVVLPYLFLRREGGRAEGR